MKKCMRNSYELFSQATAVCSIKNTERKTSITRKQCLPTQSVVSILFALNYEMYHKVSKTATVAVAGSHSEIYCDFTAHKVPRPSRQNIPINELRGLMFQMMHIVSLNAGFRNSGNNIAQAISKLRAKNSNRTVD